MPDLGKLRVFTNTYLGEPWTEQGNAPSADRIMLRREGYQPEMLRYDKEGGHEWIDAALPEGHYVLTLGADVQHDRIIVEIVAWSRGKTSHSVGHHTFEGDTSDPCSPAWQLLEECMMLEHAGHQIKLSLIDSGDQAPIVYAFCDRFGTGVAPSKGASNTITGRFVFVIREVKGHLCQRVDLDEVQLKDEFYALTKLGPVDAPSPGQTLPEGYCHFPHEINDYYGRRFFAQLYSEDKVYKQTQTGRRHYYDSRGRENHALDARVGALGALYVIAAEATAPEDEDSSGAIDWAAYWDMVDSQP